MKQECFDQVQFVINSLLLNEGQLEKSVESERKDDGHGKMK